MSAATATPSAAVPQQHPLGAPWSLQDLAVYLSISERHLVKLCDDGAIKSFHLGRRRLVSDAEARRAAEGR